MAKSKTRTWLAFGPALAAAVLTACGGGRSYDNPPEVPVGTGTTTRPATTAPTTTAFVPSTAPTTLAPPTNPPTAPPTNAPPPQTPAPTNAPPPPTEPVPTTGERYTVVQGDTLFGISGKLGVSLVQLMAANGLDENSLIVPGQQLAVPQGGAVPATNATTQAPAPTQPATNPPQTTGAPQPTEPPPPPPQAPDPTTTFAPPPDAVTPRETAASCQAPDSEEADGTPIVFAPGNVLDRNPATAWRCAAGGEQALTLTFDGETHLTSVGLIGGYVKVDPTTGVDRFEQNHRVRQVRWTFSDGTTVTQDLDDSRQMQTIDVDVTTTSVTLEILDTYPPGGDFPRDMVPVAEVQLTGGAAPAEAPPSPNGAPNAASQPQGLRINQTKASCQAPDSEEADGTPVVFSPDNVNDGNPETAWRCAAPATGETLEFTLRGQQHLTSVGLIGGYVKVDATTGVDRFPQNYRVRQVRWTFDDGTSVVQDLQDSRDLQTIDVDVSTHKVVLEILQVYEPNHEFPREFVAVAEVVLIGDR